MKRLASVLTLGAVGLVALVAAGPTLALVADHLVPLVVTVGVVTVVIRLVWFYTGRW